MLICNRNFDIQKWFRPQSEPYLVPLNFALILETHTKKISKINDKVDAIEKQNEKSKAENKKEFDKIRKEMSSNRQELEESIKASVIESLKPNVTKLQTEVKMDLKKLVREEVLEAVKPFQEQILKLRNPVPPLPVSLEEAEESVDNVEKPKSARKKKK